MKYIRYKTAHINKYQNTQAMAMYKYPEHGNCLDKHKLAGCMECMQDKNC